MLYVGMYGSVAVAAVLLYYKPDTRYVNLCAPLPAATHCKLQYQELGFGRGQGAHGGTRREALNTPVSYRVTTTHL